MLKGFDYALIQYAKKAFPIFSRLAIFVVYFWFGILKALGYSPANELVADLLQKSLPFMTPELFIVLFGFFEMLVGFAFLLPGLERAAIGALALHMFTTVLPLFLLPEIAWAGFLVPTLEGQYIIKNIVIVALAAGIGSRIKPWQDSNETNA